MDLLPDQAFRGVTAFIEQMEQFLAYATPATDLTPQEDRLHATYRQTYCFAGMDEPQTGTREVAMAGLRQSLAAGNKLRVQSRTIRMRSSTEAVVFMELLVEKDGETVGCFFDVATVRLIDGAWKLVRETMEQIAI